VCPSAVVVITAATAVSVISIIVKTIKIVSFNIEGGRECVTRNAKVVCSV